MKRYSRFLGMACRMANQGHFNHMEQKRKIRIRTGSSVLSTNLDTRLKSVAAPLASSSSSVTNVERRPLPLDVDLSYLVESLPSISSRRKEISIWECDNLRAAWRQYHQLFAEVSGTDPFRSSQMQENDLVALALCSSYAETRHLLSLLPPELRQAIVQDEKFVFTEVEEIFLHVGQNIEVRGGGWVVQLPPPSPEDLSVVLRRMGKFGQDGRSCVPGTSHRASVWRGKEGERIGVTLRVGRYVPNAARALVPLGTRGSVLIISKAGKGKTTLLRDLSSALSAQEGKPRVTVVDTSNEIGGDGISPLPFLGRCRRMQVPNRDEQGEKMIEVIQNHSPECLVVDEIASATEAEAAWSIAQRGVRLIATCHGEDLVGLLQNRELNLLVGGAAHAFLSNEERRLRNKVKKTILERPHASPFDYVVELINRNQGFLFYDVNKAVDIILDGQDAKKDITVGCPITLNEPLPERVQRLVRKKQGNPFLNQSSDVGNGNELTTDVDSNGYVNFKMETREGGSSSGSSSDRLNSRGRSNSQSYVNKNAYKKPKKKSDSELYDEISSFL